MRRVPQASRWRLSLVEPEHPEQRRSTIPRFSLSISAHKRKSPARFLWQALLRSKHLTRRPRACRDRLFTHRLARTGDCLPPYPLLTSPDRTHRHSSRTLPWVTKNKTRWISPAGFFVTRQRPTFPRPHGSSSIGLGGLNFRVRDGNGCGPSGMATGNMHTEQVFTAMQLCDC